MKIQICRADKSRAGKPESLKKHSTRETHEKKKADIATRFRIIRNHNVAVDVREIRLESPFQGT